jgi:hypothetical protein
MATRDHLCRTEAILRQGCKVHERATGSGKSVDESHEINAGSRDRIGKADRFKPLELAVSFDPEWTYEKPDPFNILQSKRFTNAQGVEQGTYVHLGNCDIGCDVDAKNTLDQNYIRGRRNTERMCGLFIWLPISLR